jgi:hypothetical protein
VKTASFFSFAAATLARVLVPASDAFAQGRVFFNNRYISGIGAPLHRAHSFCHHFECARSRFCNIPNAGVGYRAFAGHVS